VRWWIGHIDTVGKYANGRSARSKCAPMRSNVDAECATREHGHALLDKIGGEVCRNAVSVRRGCPRADDRNRAFHQMSQMPRTA
jgi:hypothetical protein